jgi:hypothetical protein
MNLALSKPLSRRTMLKGVGAALALPWMETMTPAIAKAPTLKKPPLRAAFMFMPNGVVPEEWKPPGEGEDYEVTPLLKPFADRGLKGDILLLENLWNANSTGRNGHWPKVPAWLSGGYVERGIGSDLDTGGTTVDQVMARHVGHRTALPSFELGIDEPRTGVDNVGGGFPRIVGSYISWRDPHTPVAKEINPKNAFDRLFRTRSLPLVAGMKGDSAKLRNSLQADDASLLDLVLDDAKRLQKRISSHDRVKLDEYLESVRAVERQIEATLKPQKRWVNGSGYEVSRPVGIPTNHAEHVKLMLDIMVLGFWTDSTRISTMMLGDAQSGATFEFLDGVGRKSFHGYSHHREKEMKPAYRSIVNWHIEQVAYVLHKMKSLDEGGSSLLDNSMVMFGSSLKDGNKHAEHDLPIILAGKGQGALRPGRRVRAPKNTPLCNLYVALLQRMGIDEKQFGDSTGALKGLG